MKTIKQIADSLGIDKQRVYRYIRKNHIGEAHHEMGMMWYEEREELAIIQHFSNKTTSSEAHHDVLQTTSNDTVIDTVIAMLKKELDIKNKQIDELNARLAESNAALVVAQQSAQVAQALHAGTMHKQLGAGAGNPQQEDTAEPRKQPGLFTRIFGNK